MCSFGNRRHQSLVTGLHLNRQIYVGILFPCWWSLPLFFFSLLEASLQAHHYLLFSMQSSGVMILGWNKAKNYEQRSCHLSSWVCSPVKSWSCEIGRSLEILATSLCCAKFQRKVFLYPPNGLVANPPLRTMGGWPPSQLHSFRCSSHQPPNKGMTDDQPTLFRLRKAFHEVMIINSKTTCETK